MGAGGRFGGAKDRGFLVADAPVPRRDKCALPHPGPGVARSLLVLIVIMGNPHIGQRPAAPHQPFLDVLAIDVAPRHQAAAPVGLAHVAGPALVLDVLDEFVARGDAAAPAFARVVQAELIHRRSVDAAQPNSGRADLNLIAFADLWNAADIGGLRDGRQHDQSNRQQEFHRHAKTVFGFAAILESQRMALRL